jgi:hypothetical protein
MQGYHVVAVFESYDDADSARRQLLNAGVGGDRIHLSHDSPHEENTRQPRGFWGWLFGGGGSRRESEWYRQNLVGGRTAVSVLVPEDHDHIWVAQQLVGAGALDLEDEEDPSVTGQSIREGRRGGEAADWSSEGSNWGQGSEERMIPILHEGPDAGRRQTVNRYRVRVHTIERPVEQDVSQRDERAIVETRPEAVERSDEPAAPERVRADEEVMVRKDLRDRTEQAPDKVRPTQIDLESGVGEENRPLGR